MAPVAYASVAALEDNAADVYMSCTEVLIKIARNILKEPENPRFRSVSLGSNVVKTKLLPASGAMECLFEMGFEEAADKLVLPQGSSLERLKRIHDELTRRREAKTKSPPTPAPFVPATENATLASIGEQIKELTDSLSNKFLREILQTVVEVCKCESTSLQLKALKCVPLVSLKKNVERIIREVQVLVKKNRTEAEDVDCQEMLLLELCKWFKNDFFRWVNAPECTKCGNEDTTFVSKKPNPKYDCPAVEEYACLACDERVFFPRYRDAGKLLETRRGRCGEWAKCFYLICRALGWDSRLVVDSTDHVWVEVYSIARKRWMHCDPCETAVDSPLMYECGWKKNLSYVLAYSKDEMQDVTWRYSCEHAKVLGNRRSCTEEQLVDVISSVRRILLGFASPRRREFVVKRTALELVDLMAEKAVTEAETKGRISGSLAWRLARGELSPVAAEFKPRVWRPEEDDVKNMRFALSYCTSSDEYTSGGTNAVTKGWESGFYRIDSVFRKEERDWKTAYLARKEGSERGTLTWRFEAVDDLAIGDVELKLVSQMYESGRIVCKLCDDKTCVRIPNGKDSFSTRDFRGSKHVELVVELSGGNGDNAWQHAQLLRQPMSEFEKTFQVVINLIRIS